MKIIRKIMNFIVAIELLILTTIAIYTTVIKYPTMDPLGKVFLWIGVIMASIIFPTNLFWWIRDKIKNQNI